MLRLGDLRDRAGGPTASRAGSARSTFEDRVRLARVARAQRRVVLDHTTIYDRIWHYDFGPDSKNLAVYIGYLRRKTEKAVASG